MKKLNLQKRIFFILLFFGGMFLGCSAQSIDQKYIGNFYSSTENIYLKINLKQSDIIIPGMEFLGPTHGYLHGNIYGIWMITRYKITKNYAQIRLSNDAGSDSQTAELTIANDSSLLFKTIDGNKIKKVVKRKLIKIPNEIIMVKTSK